MDKIEKHEFRKNCLDLEYDNIKSPRWLKKFLREMEIATLPYTTTASGNTTIQQTLRNELRQIGVNAFKRDLIDVYGDDFDVIETKEGLVIAAENMPSNLTISWEIKTTIKSVDYDPFMEAQKWEDEQAAKEVAKQERALAKELKRLKKTLDSEI